MKPNKSSNAPVNYAAGSIDGVATLDSELTAGDSSLVSNDALLAAILSGSGDCIKILDLEGRLQFISDGGKRVMEIDDFSALKGCPWPDLWADEGNRAARDAINQAQTGRVARFTGMANTAKGNARHWDVQVLPIFGADGAPTHLLSISRDVSDLRESEARHAFLNAELQHRIKNMLAMVSAIASQTLKGSEIAERRQVFTARIGALSHAHDILVQTEWKGASLRSVIEATLVTNAADAHCFSITGPDIELAPAKALSMTLAIHELATNAAKYGALSTPSGRVEIEWQIDSDADPRFSFRWREVGGPAVGTPTFEGFGSKLISRVLAADFNGQVRTQYLPSGFVCEFTCRAASLSGADGPA